MVSSYPVPGKRKSFDICQAFLEGSRGAAEDAAVFYGVTETNFDAWKQVLRRHRTFYYIDNSYFDETRGTHYRVTKNAIQYHVQNHDQSDGSRLYSIFGSAWALKPLRSIGEPGHIVVCPQSDIFMSLIAGYHGNWLKDTVAMCERTWPDREIRVRAWNPDKIALARTLKQDLEGASQLVTHTSAAAITALMEGVMPIVDRMHALAQYVFRQEHASDQRYHFLEVLADNQWTLDEIRAGKAWQWLNR